MAPLPSDEELIARVIAADDRRAFEQLVHRYQSLVRGFLRQLTGDAATADDLGQETFLKAYRKLAHFRGDAKLSTWLVAIAYNECREMARRRAHQQKVVSALRRESATRDVELRAEVFDLPKLLAWLDEDERIAMVLSYAHEFSHREIALVTGWPIGTVKSHLSRGKARILARLDATETHDVR